MEEHLHGWQSSDQTLTPPLLSALSVHSDHTCSFPQQILSFSRLSPSDHTQGSPPAMSLDMLLPPSPPDITLSIPSRMGRKMRPSYDHTAIVYIPIKKRTVLRANVIFHYYVTLNNIAILLKRDKQREWTMRQSHKAGILFGHSKILPGSICQLLTT